MENALIPSMSMEEYHRDPCPTPSLSSGIARELWAKTPMHAWFKHPRLNPQYRNEERGEFDVGSAIHGIVLEPGDNNIEIIDADSYRTKLAQELRDAARAAGRTPVLVGKYGPLMEAAQAATHAIRQSEFADDWEAGISEASAFAIDGDLWLRSRFDRLAPTDAKQRIIFDVKTVSGSANPGDFCRKIGPMGYDIQAALYRRVLAAILGDINERDILFVWLVVETEEPYGASVVACGPSMTDVGFRKLDIVEAQFAACLAADRWPGYDGRTAWAEASPWEIAAVEEREMNAAMVSEGKEGE